MHTTIPAPRWWPSAEPLDLAAAGPWGADLVVTLDGVHAEEDVAAAFASWCADHAPWALLAPSTIWGREVAARMAARLGAGLVGDANDLEVDSSGRLVCWKPAFSGALVAAVTCRSPIQMATVRGGVLPLLAPRAAVARQAPPLSITPRRRVLVVRRSRDDDLDALATARVVVAAGVGVPPDDYLCCGHCWTPSAQSWPPPAKSPTRAGSHARGRWASPAAASRRACL